MIKGCKSTQYQSFWEKSGINFRKYHDEKRKSEKKTCDFDSDYLIDEMVNELYQLSHNSWYESRKEYLFNFLINTDADDHPFCKNLKKSMVGEYKGFLKRIMNTRCFDYSYISHLVYSQLMHYSNLSTKPESLTFFNCGIPNFLCIVGGGMKIFSDDKGRPFISCVITKNPDDYTNFYGKINKIKLLDGSWLIYTSWRRLNNSKIAFMRDSFYSTLSSTLSL
jgi:hypothetical protein